MLSHKIKVDSSAKCGTPSQQKSRQEITRFKDGSVYTGEMKGRKPNGKGKTVFKNGDVYEGEYVKGKREGFGCYTFPDGERYEGNGIKTSSMVTESTIL